MDEWNDDSKFSGGTSTRSWEEHAAPKGIQTGGWHWVMTMICFVTVMALSFLMAWLTKDTVNRPFWMIGAIFTVPTLGMFAAALLVEKKTSAMTPVSSRKAQYLVALVAIVATFVVGCVCDLLYQHSTMGLVIQNWAETHPPETVYSDIVLMVDKSSSLEENGMDRLNRKAIKEWVDGMDDKARVGVVVFSFDVLQTVPVDTLAVNREKIRNAMDVDTCGYTDFDIALYHAFRMIDVAETGRVKGRTTQIIAITDAEAELPDAVKDCLVQMAKEKDVVFSIVHLGHDVPANNPLVKLASSTGGTGTSLGVSELAQYFEGVQNAEEPDWDAYYAELRNNGKVDFDLIRVSDPEANLLCGVMLGLEGLAIGICLMMMLSVVGQKRIQPVISIVMATAAFVLLKIYGPGVGPVDGSPRIQVAQWLLEGVSFSLLGLVFMRKNNGGSSVSGQNTGKVCGGSGIKPAQNDSGGESSDDIW